jgi:2-oxoisovalerate dehydrogenase E1 component
MAKSAVKLKTGSVGLRSGLDKNALLSLYERMVLLRRFESAAQIACRKGETPGFLHL